MSESIQYQQLDKGHFDAVITLGEKVHGKNYLDLAALDKIYSQSWHNNINASWVALSGTELVGFRLTYAAPNWELDKWCSSHLWPVEQSKVCYFKCNTVAEEKRGLGIGASLLRRSIQSAKQQGALAGLAHIWLDSPGNSAFGYFSACGGELVAKHPNRWQHLSLEEGYECPICGNLCECTAAEMILTF